MSRSYNQVTLANLLVYLEGNKVEELDPWQVTTANDTSISIKASQSQRK